MLDAHLRGMFSEHEGQSVLLRLRSSANDDKTIKRMRRLRLSEQPSTATYPHGRHSLALHPSAQKQNPRIDAYGNPVRMAVSFDQIVIGDGRRTTWLKLLQIGQSASTIIYPDPQAISSSTRGPPDNEILKQNGFTNIKVQERRPRWIT